MELMSQIANVKNKISGTISFNENLSKLSWFNLGGPAKVLFRPNSLQELSLFLKEIKGIKKIKVLGIGSNTLIREGGFDGIIIKFGNSFSHLSLFNSDTIIAVQQKINIFMKEKKNTQPSKIKTCGSTFKNPENQKAWKLIKDSGCVGMAVGDAQISEKHCNFFVNKGNAKSKDLEQLINQVQSKVLEKTGINLELELQIIGEKHE